MNKSAKDSGHYQLRLEVLKLAKRWKPKMKAGR